MKRFYALFGALTLLLLSNSLLAQDKSNCSLLYNWYDDDLPSSFAHDNTYNEIWGYEADGHEYAIIGTTEGTHIFDLTDGQEQEVAFVEGAVTGTQIVHRDYHDYQGYLYAVCDEGPSTLQIIDLSGLPNSVEVVYDSADLILRAHNIFIDEDSGLMYRCGGNDQFSVFSLENPELPELVIDCDAEVENWTSTVGYVHDVFVRDGVAYCNAGSNGLYIIDFSIPTEPVTLGSLEDYEDSGYNHSGWLHEEGTIYALADETHGKRVKIIDVSDPTDPQVIAFVHSDVNALSIPHNLIFEGDLLHISYYVDGYYVWDLSDPTNPSLFAYYDTSEYPHTSGYKGAWGVYPFLSSGKQLVSDMQEGLFVFELGATNINSAPDSFELGAYPNPLVSENVSIDLPNGFGDQVVINIYDQQGKLVDTQNLLVNGSTLAVPLELPKGIYQVRIQGESTVGMTSLIKL